MSNASERLKAAEAKIKILEAELVKAEAIIKANEAKEDAARAKDTARATRHNLIVESRRELIQLMTSIVIVLRLFFFVMQMMQPGANNLDPYQNKAKKANYCDNNYCPRYQSTFDFDELNSCPAVSFSDVFCNDGRFMYRHDV
uniref:Chitin-binding type-2 domain-containing protein n=1 Tax=Panagrellus redivivus TaxID=6233 RepID=A0A7E4UY80_PANRE